MIKSKTIPILYEKKENCSGCTACYAICPKEAISMVEDEEGFEYPQMDYQILKHFARCIDLGEVSIMHTITMWNCWLIAVLLAH